MADRDKLALRTLILSILEGGPSAGRDTRAKLAEQGRSLSGAAFYNFMAHMEDDDLIQGWYEDGEIDGTPIKARWHCITEVGRRALATAREEPPR